MKTTEQMIEVMQAHLRGELIEYRGQRSDYWDTNKSPVWNWGSYDYRVAPEQQRPAAEEKRP